VFATCFMSGAMNLMYQVKRDHGTVEGMGICIMKDHQKAAITDWHKLLQSREEQIKNLVLELRFASGDGLQCLLVRDINILEIKKPIVVAWVFILTIRAPVCYGKSVQPWLWHFVSDAMRVGNDNGWDKRGFVTSSMRLIECALFLEKMLLTLFEMQACGTEVMAEPENDWIRQLMMHGA